jgi:hypothetical protein
MSEGGTATFNNGVVVGGDLTVQGTTTTLNTATLDVEDKNITLNAGSGDTSGSANGAGITIQDAVDASNDATILWDASNAKFDFSHPVNISHGTPVLTLTDTSSSATTTITLNGVDTTIDSNGTDGDIIFKGNDGGSEITALTLDMSAAGAATFNSSITSGSFIQANGHISTGSNSGRLRAGASNEIELSHDGSHGELDCDTGNLTIDAAGDIILDADGDNVYFKAGGGNLSSFSFINSDVYLGVETQDKDLIIRGNDGGSTITALTLDMSNNGRAVFNAGAGFFDHVNFNDNAKAVFGGGDDLEIYHDGSHSNIVDNGTGNLRLFGNTQIFFGRSVGGEAYATFNSDSSVNLYYNNAIKFETTSSGVLVNGTVAGDVVSAHTTENTVANDDVIAFYDTSAGAIRKTAVSNLLGGSGGGSAADDITTGDAAVTIGTSSGNITLDTPGDILFDAGNGVFKLRDDGSDKGRITTASDIISIVNSTQDGDIKFDGLDGSSSITALRLDMSAAGLATFNDGVKADYFKATGSIPSETSASTAYLDFASGNARIITKGADGSTQGGFQILQQASDSSPANTPFAIDSSGNITLTGTLAHASDFTIDVGGDITLDADGENIKFKDAGTEVGQIDLGSQNFTFRSQVDDKDIIFRGQDSTSEIVALTLDMSEAGAATFNNNVTAFSDERLKDNIETLEDGLDKVEQLRGVTYTRDDREEIGVIAQEVEKILPEIVLTADDEMGTKSVDYSRITAVLIEAVKELSAKVKELESK